MHRLDEMHEKSPQHGNPVGSHGSRYAAPTRHGTQTPSRHTCSLSQLPNGHVASVVVVVFVLVVDVDVVVVVGVSVVVVIVGQGPVHSNDETPPPPMHGEAKVGQTDSHEV